MSDPVQVRETLPIQRANVLGHVADTLPEELAAVEVAISETYDRLRALESYLDKLRRVAREAL